MKMCDEVQNEILKLDPCNARLKLEVTQKLIGGGELMKGYTEYLRFEALVESKT